MFLPSNSLTCSSLSYSLPPIPSSDSQGFVLFFLLFFFVPYTECSQEFEQLTRLPGRPAGSNQDPPFRHQPDVTLIPSRSSCTTSQRSFLPLLPGPTSNGLDLPIHHHPDLFVNLTLPCSFASCCFSLCHVPTRTWSSGVIMSIRPTTAVSTWNGSGKHDECHRQDFHLSQTLTLARSFDTSREPAPMLGRCADTAQTF